MTNGKNKKWHSHTDEQTQSKREGQQTVNRMNESKVTIFGSNVRVLHWNTPDGWPQAIFNLLKEVIMG